MRVRLDTYQSVHRSIRWRSLLLLAAGAIGVVLSSFGALLGLLMFVMDDGGLWARRTGIVIGVFAGAFPLAGAVVMLWRGAVGRRRLARLRDLAAVARARPSFNAHDVSQTLGVHRLDAERLVVDAAALGLLEDIDVAIVNAPSAPGALAASGPQWPETNDASGVRRAQPDQRSDPMALNNMGHMPGSAELAPTLPASGPRPTSMPAFEAGAVLNGTYRIEGRLGAGGMGLVYAARHLRTGRRYAVKTLLPDAQLSPEAIKRFEREAMAASALGHPGIIAVHDFHETESGVHYIVMDLLEGETLDERLSRAGSLGWPEARKVALEVGAALVAAHERGLLHRDLKPANIFLARGEGAPERAVVLDFGLAKPISDAMVSRITVTGAAVGTPMYMSPEQARGEVLDVRSDVYGLAAVIYEMVTGAPPFLDRTLAAVYARLLTESAPAASAMARFPCPPGVDDILSCALAKSPSERFDTMRALCGAISAVGDGEAARASA